MKIELWFEDELRAGLRGTIVKIWGEKGLRPMIPQQQDFDWAYTFGAVCPARGKTAAIVVPYANTEAILKHFSEYALKGDFRGNRKEESCYSGIGQSRLAYN